MNISIEYHGLSNDDIPKELFEPKYNIDGKSLINDQEEGESFNNISNIQKVNFFIGANNSGKSRFLRAIFKLRDINLYSLENSEKSLLQAINSINDQFKTLNIHDSETLFDKNGERGKFGGLYNRLGLSRSPSDAILNYNNKDSTIKEIKEFESRIDELKPQEHSGKDEKEISDIKDLIKQILDLDSKLQYHEKNKPSKKTYIPILRYLNSGSNLSTQNYLEVINEQYGIEENVLVGLNIPGEIDSLRHNFESKKVKENFEEFLAKNFFNDIKVSIIVGQKGVLKLYVNGDTNEREFYNLGDGLQALILILFPIFIARQNEWLFIEEPETHLHPGYQRIFLDTILNNKFIKDKNLKLFFTTHSNHFLDQSLICDDVSIFQFKKENEKEIEIKSNVKPSKEILDILGVTNASVLISNSSIWVEGPTDRKYISKWLSVYPDFKLKEDIDYTFFEYGGNLIAHYLFDDNFEDSEEVVIDKINSFALSNRIYLLSDNDNPKKGSVKSKRIDDLKKLSDGKDNFLYQNTEVKEIENLLPVEILRDFLPKLVKNEEKYSTKISEIIFERSEYKRKGLGLFFYELLNKNGIPKKDLYAFKDTSGTLKLVYKLKLCNFVIDKEYLYNDFVEDNNILKKMIDKLYEFIKPK